MKYLLKTIIMLSFIVLGLTPCCAAPQRVSFNTDSLNPLSVEEIKGFDCTRIRPGGNEMREIFMEQQEWELQLTFRGCLENPEDLMPPDDMITTMLTYPGSPVKVCLNNGQYCEDQTSALRFCPQGDLIYIRFYNLAVQGSCTGCGILLVGQLSFKEGVPVLDIRGEAYDCWDYGDAYGKFFVFGRAHLKE